MLGSFPPSLGCFEQSKFTRQSGADTVIESANNFNGEELSAEAAAEIGLTIGSGGVSLRPLVPGFDFKLTQWELVALDKLKNPGCNRFFGGRGITTIKSTRYIPFAAAPNIFGETYPGSKVVWINMLSWIYQSKPGQLFDQAFRPGGLSSEESGGYGLMHEASHQLKPITGTPSDWDAGINYFNSLRVMNACP